ncbi:MAG: hypothetical protein WD768_18095 [Phycisphaeraceae bacterium]
MPTLQCPACKCDLAGQTAGDCRQCGYTPNWKALLAHTDKPEGTINLHCPACAYDLRGTPEGDCPECGAHLDREVILAAVTTSPRLHTWSIVLLVALPFITLLVSQPSPNIGWFGAIWATSGVLMVYTVVVVASMQTRRLCIRRVVVWGKPPSAWYETIVFVSAVLGLAAYAGIVMVITLRIALRLYVGR